jgi:hypothetical protein
MLCPTKEMEVRAETEYLAYRKAIDFESDARSSGRFTETFAALLMRQIRIPKLWLLTPLPFKINALFKRGKTAFQSKSGSSARCRNVGVLAYSLAGAQRSELNRPANVCPQDAGLIVASVFG